MEQAEAAAPRGLMIQQRLVGGYVPAQLDRAGRRAPLLLLSDRVDPRLHTDAAGVGRCRHRVELTSRRSGSVLQNAKPFTFRKPGAPVGESIFVPRRAEQTARERLDRFPAVALIALGERHAATRGGTATRPIPPRGRERLAPPWPLTAPDTHAGLRACSPRCRDGRDPPAASPRPCGPQQWLGP